MATRYYILRDNGHVDTGYADGSHQVEFANYNDFAYYVQQAKELVYQVLSDLQAHQILANPQNAPAGYPLTGSGFDLSQMPWWGWVAGGYVAWKILFR